MRQIVTTTKLLSKDTAGKLDAALSKGNIEQLRKYMERLFSFKNIFNLHDDHLIELAECIVDLARADDRLEYADGMERYAQKRISRYLERKTRVIKENSWAKATKHINKETMLDLTYRQWVYESGFEYSKFQMYTMLCDIIHDIQQSEKEGKK